MVWLIISSIIAAIVVQFFVEAVLEIKLHLRPIPSQFVFVTTATLS